MRRNLATASLGVFLVSVLVCVGCKPVAETKRPAHARSQSSLTVNTVVAQGAESFTKQRMYTGIVKAQREGDVGFTRAGRVTRILVEEGDKVQTGQLIAELDQRRLTLKKTTLEDALELAGGSQLEEDAEPAEPSIDELRNSIGKLKDELNQLETELFARPQQPLEPGVPTRSFSDRMNDVETRIVALDRTARRDQAGQVADLEAQLQDLDLQIEEGTITAPYDGIITLRHVSEGAVVSAGMPIVRLVQRDPLEVWVGVPREIAAEMAVGEPLDVVSQGERFTASLKAKLPQLDRTTRTRTVILELALADESGILPGDVVQVKLQLKNTLAGFWLPLSSLSRGVGGQWSVYVVEGQQGSQVVARRLVELVHHEEDRVYVRGDLLGGELVVAGGTHRIVPKQRVTSRNAMSGDPSTASLEPTS